MKNKKMSNKTKLLNELQFNYNLFCRREMIIKSELIQILNLHFILIIFTCTQKQKKIILKYILKKLLFIMSTIYVYEKSS